jgi:hypothetical protein
MIRPKLPKPKRPMSAYNFFFRDERNNILASLPGPDTPSTSSRKRRGHGKISFVELGKTVSARWKVVSPARLAAYRVLAKQDKLRYKTQMAYKKYQEALEFEQRPTLSATTFGTNPSFSPTSSATEADIQAERIQELAIKLGPEAIDFLIRE